FRGYDFDVKEATLAFDDPLDLRPRIDLVASTEFRRAGDVAAPFGVQGTFGPSVGGTNAVSITLRAYGDPDDLRLTLSSDPSLSQEDIVLLLTIGLTRSELEQMQATAGPFTSSGTFQALASFSGAEKIVKDVVPIDDFRFGTAYVPRLARMEPELTIAKR